jgi:hypothetical protein
MKNPKTTISGIGLICSGIIGLYFAIQTKNINEGTLTTVVGSILGGMGLIFGADSKTE